MEILSRNIATHDTETILMLVCLLLIAIARIFHTHKFDHFLLIFFSNKYVKIYGRERGFYYNWFHLPLFIVQLISLGLFAKILVVYFNLNIVFNVLVVILFVAIFILTKFLIDKLLSAIFSIEKFVTKYNFYKLNYWNFMGIALLPFNALLIYNPMNMAVTLYITIAIFSLLSIIAIFLVLKSNQKIISGNLFYFILYLCTLEIAPYLIVAKSLIIT